MSEEIRYHPLEVSLRIGIKNNKPCLEIRKVITDTTIIKQVITSAFNEIPIQTQPKFTNKMKSISTLQEKGILYYEDGNYYFTI